jgi:hypothetical protein
MSEDDTLEHHLAERLKEARDFANFSAHRPQAGSQEDVERVVALPEHLGGRAISDKFVRSKGPEAPKPQEAPKKPVLEHHLKSRLAEIQDQSAFGTAKSNDPIEAYRRMRRDMGGS